MTRRASARPDDITYSVNSLKLPALNSTAVEDFVCCFVHFIRLICLNEFLHVLSIFVVFTRHDQVYVRRIFIFNKDTVFCRRQADLAGVGGVDDRQCDLSIVQRTRQLRRFQFNQLQVFGFSITSSAVGSRPTPSFSLIKPTFCSSSKERPRLVGSFGIATCEPSCSSSSDLIFGIARNRVNKSIAYSNQLVTAIFDLLIRYGLCWKALASISPLLSASLGRT